jgi:protein-S-isoprenylcysteine O-methyltransferase Ste14
MIGEVSLFGLFVPPLLLLMLPALLVSRVLGFVLARTGFYRLVWHPALFDLSLFVIVLGSLAFFASNWS